MSSHQQFIICLSHRSSENVLWFQLLCCVDFQLLSVLYQCNMKIFSLSSGVCNHYYYVFRSAVNNCFPLANNLSVWWFTLLMNDFTYKEKSGKTVLFIRQRKAWNIVVWEGETSERHVVLAILFVILLWLWQPFTAVVGFNRVLCLLCSQDCLSVPDIKTAFSDCAPKIGKRDCLVQPCTALTG